MANVLSVAKKSLLFRKKLWSKLQKKQPEDAEASFQQCSIVTEKIKCLNVEYRGLEEVIKAWQTGFV
jgi:hypothetical protein